MHCLAMQLHAHSSPSAARKICEISCFGKIALCYLRLMRSFVLETHVPRWQSVCHGLCVTEGGRAYAWGSNPVGTYATVCGPKSREIGSLKAWFVALGTCRMDSWAAATCAIEQVQS